MALTDTELLEAIGLKVAEEVRCELLMHGPQIAELPPPSDIASERLIISALLSGDATPETVRPLVAEDFFVPLHQVLFASVEALAESGKRMSADPHSMALVVTALRAQGVGGRVEDWIDHLLLLRDGEPFLVDLSRAVARVLETSNARSLSSSVRAIDQRLRLGMVSSEQALAELNLLEIQ